MTDTIKTREPASLLITWSDGMTSEIVFPSPEHAQNYADDLILTMDSAEARETEFRIVY